MGRGNVKKSLLRILIIEDNLDHVELLSSMIERHFAPVDLHTVESIDDAIDFIEQTGYDLVLTDCYINNTSIVDRIPHLRNKLGDTPIIVVTGSGDENLAADVIKKGATDYLVKTKDSLENIPTLINKYTNRETNGESRHRSGKKETESVKEKIMNEMADLNRQAKRIPSHSSERIPDLKQLESLLSQIEQLKKLASKLMKK